MPTRPIRVLGIDPGFGRVGFGVVEYNQGKIQYVAHGLIETSPKKKFADRLVYIHDHIKKIVLQYKPELAGVEELFFSKNVTTAIQVAQARGVILLTLAQENLPLEECTPLQVKQALTGYGRAEKDQVQKMVSMILSLPKEKIQDDAADALAIAITCAAQIPFQNKINRVGIDKTSKI